MKNIFRAYDDDNSGKLDTTEVVTLINDTFSQLQHNRKITNQELMEFMSQGDTDQDGCISQNELFGFFKNMLQKYAQERKYWSVILLIIQLAPLIIIGLNKLISHKRVLHH